MVGAVGVVVEGGCLTIRSGGGGPSESSMGVGGSSRSQSSSTGLWEAIAMRLLLPTGATLALALCVGRDRRFLLGSIRACRR